MLKNYFLIAFRNLTRQRFYSFLNIAGLATGMAVSLMIGLWVYNEMTYNYYHRNHSRLGIVYDTQVSNGARHSENAVDIPLADELRREYGDDLNHVTLATPYETHLVSTGQAADKKIERTCRWVGAELPGMFTLHMLRGSDFCLQDPSSALLTASMARSLFGAADPIGRTVIIDGHLAFRVAGVYEDVPENTDLHGVDFLLPWEKYAETHSWIRGSQQEWGNYYARVFVQLKNGVDFDRLSAKIAYIPRRHLAKSMDSLFIQPMNRYHLYGNFQNGKPAGGQIRFVRMFSIIAISILLLACINFMNLSTARSERRAREVGIRKTLGSHRGQLIGQFLGESVIMALLALVFGVLLTVLLLPMFNGMAHRQLKIPWRQSSFWWIALGVALFTGLVSGSYPALYLSRFQPVKILKGAMRAGQYATLPRKILVVIQFTVSVFLVLGTLVIYRQIQYARNRPTGYVREGLLNVDMLNNSGLRFRYNAIRSDLLASGAAQDVTASNGPMTDTWSVRGGLNWNGKDPYSNPQFGWVSITHDYGKTVGWQILQGHEPSRSWSGDSLGLVLNEAAVKLAGFQDPIGQRITVDSISRPVIAVVKDLVMDSPYDAPLPTIFFMDYNWFNYVTIRLNRNMRPAEAMTRIQQVFRKYDPDGLVSYQMADDAYERNFDVEQRVGEVSTFFTALAIFISCLGLFGLASFVAEQRTREIGLRKVLGASVFNLWSALSRDFVTLVIIACVIALPLSGWLMHEWLQKYAYRTELSWWLFASAAGGALIVTLITVSYQTLRAAMANPVNSIRAE
ncbi:MAG TPA: ABC transporter permease [Puia sp.]|nr:ABC transporter permease [Puia sp.]